MKNTFYHIVLIILLTGAYSASGQYTLDNTGGKINNRGTIKIKNGQVKALNDTLGGRIEFKQTTSDSYQVIPNIVYNQLVIMNKGKRIVLDEKNTSNQVKNLVVRDSLVVIDEAELTTQYTGWNPADIYAKGAIDNTAKIAGPKQIVVTNETQSQDIKGNGRYSNLNIDNPNGVNVVAGGGFTVENDLTLTRGKLNNTTDNNFKMADSSKITRYASGSIAASPDFEGRVSVTYTGGGNAIVAGPEIPDAPEKLQDLFVENNGGLIFNKNVQVNRSLYVGSRIVTEFDDTRRFVLTYTPALNPSFSNSPYAEIEGTIRRTTLSLDSTKNLFNNQYTWALFRNSANAGSAAALNFRIKPRVFYSYPEATDNKVKRTIEVWAENIGGDTLKFVPAMDIGYAWRYEPTDTLDENLGLPKEQLLLKRWNESNFTDIASSSIPAFSADTNWITANATNIDLLGQFVVGMPGGGVVTMKAKVFLEGPYANKSMSTDMAKYELFDSIPKDEYPYNLDPKRALRKAKIALDTMVDWLVLEFRRDAQPSKYVCYLLRKDGVIVDENGDTVLNLIKAGIDSGEYYVGILHRNHLPVYSSNKLKIYPDNNGQVADMTNNSNVYGKEGSLKALDVVNGFVLWGMVAGDVDGDNDIDETDYRLTWMNRDLLYQYSRYDINMSGYVNTKDINFPWNNLNRQANIP